MRRGLSIAPIAVLFALAAAIGLQRIRDFDYWWHLKSGELIAATASVPTQDLFTYTVPGNRWIDIHWLFQLALHGLHRLGGHDAVVLGQLAAVAALVSILLPIGWRRDRAWVSALLLGLLLLVSGDRVVPRPELPSFVLLAAVLLLLDRHEREGGRAVWAVVPLQVVWANVHGLFALGVALCAIAAAAEWIRPVVAPGQPVRRDRALRLSALAAAAALACLVNPNGIDGALYPVEQLRMVGPPDERGLFGTIIAELVPPLGSGRGLPPLALGLAGALAALSFGAMALNWRRVSAFDPLAWVAFLYLALGAQRNVALFAIVAAPIGVRNANAFLDAHPFPRAARAAANAAAAALLAVATWSVASDRYYVRISSYREAGLGVLEWLNPVGAADWLARERPPGAIAHHMADGGYLIWRLWPEQRVMVDGRLEVFGPDTFAELQIVDVERFRALDARYHFGSVLLHYSLFPPPGLMRWLYLNPNWRLVHADDTAVVFVRDEAGTAPWPALDVDAPDLFPAFDEARSVSDRARRHSRATFYFELRRFEAALAIWEEAIRRYPDLPEGRLIHATLLQANGRAAAAEAILRDELRRRPDDPALLARVGRIREEAGDREEARALYDRALALDSSQRFAAFQRALMAEADGDLETAAFHYARLAATPSHAGDPIALSAAQRMRRLGAAALP